MRFAALLAATIAAVAAREEDFELLEIPPVPLPSEFNKKSYYRRVKDPNVRARYKNAMDRCRGQLNEKRRYKCFKRNWNLFKPHRQNKLNDLRARTHRACWRYKNNLLKRAKCFDRYIKDYKGELAKGLLADDQDEVEQKFQNAVEGPDATDDDEALVAMDHVNERELSSASSTDSEASSSSSEDTSDDNNHKARVPTANKLASGERRAGRKERIAGLKKASAKRAAAKKAAPAKK